MTGHCQRTQLELYGLVIAAHQKATFFQLQRKAFWHLVEKKSWFYLILFLLSSILHIAILFPILIVFFYHVLEEMYMISFLVLLFSLSIISIAFALLFRYILEKSLVCYFGIIGHKYGSLINAFGRNWEFYSYLLFRDELTQCEFKSEDVKKVMPLFEVEQQTLGAYVARNPLIAWIYGTSGAVLAASASNWPLIVVILVAFIGGLGIAILHVIPTFITNQRRQYELHRWLAWYKADLRT